MKKIADVIYIVLCLSLCILPFAGMVVAPTETTTENREMARFPECKTDGQWNYEFAQELGAYFNDHFAFRTQLVMADSVIQSKVFGVSNMDTVIVGEDGWLYYASTLPDYLGTNEMSERELFNAANNISLMKDAVESKGTQFLLTVAPNKNSLYGEYMPYYDSIKVGTDANIDKLEEKFQSMQIPYVDLFTTFSQQDEILYLKKDSHWNEKGAVLAYNALLDGLELGHETYETVENVRTKTEYGDLNKMIYPIAFEPEWNYHYNVDNGYAYVTDTESVEDAWIETVNEDGTESLLMFRDSFGNTLLPYMANTFGHAYFSKSVPYRIEEYMEEYSPSYVVVEKVERNISEFAKEPPIMTGPVVDMVVPEKLKETDTTVSFQSSEVNADYWEITGMITTDYIKEDTKVYVAVITDEGSVCYEAFTVTKEGADNGYKLYVLKENITVDDIQIAVMVHNEEVQKVASVAVEDISLLGIE